MGKSQTESLNQQINTCGDSAGGDLALVVPMMARDRNDPKVAHQITVYPCSDVPAETNAYSKAKIRSAISMQLVC